MKNYNVPKNGEQSAGNESELNGLKKMEQSMYGGNQAFYQTHILCTCNPLATCVGGDEDVQAPSKGGQNAPWRCAKTCAPRIALHHQYRFNWIHASVE